MISIGILYVSLKKIKIMEYVAKLIGMTVEELKDFYIEKVNQARSFGFTEEEAKQLVQETFRKKLGL
jgi:hypothetical protein